MPISVNPQGKLSLVRTNLETDYKNTFTFSNLAAQTAYFDGLTSEIIAATDYSYMRKDGKIRVAIPVDNIINYNYLFYANTGFSNKRYYCFITRMEYVNENCTDLYIQTDVFQTWYFELTWNRCFVEREHVSNDAIGVHTFPEDLETGEYVNHDDKVNFGIGNCHAVVCVSEDPFHQDTNYPNQLINNVPTGLHYFLVKDWVGNSVSFIGYIVDWAAKKSDLSLINSIYMVPDSMTDYNNISSDQSAPKHWSYALPDGGLNNAAYYKLPEFITGSFDMGTTTITKPYNNIDGYVPKNNKLFCWPYNFLMVDNNAGSAYEYRYENFSTTTCVFSTTGTISPGCSIKTIPKNYEHIEWNHACSLMGMKLPIGSWDGDVYTNWLTQNSVNIGASIAQDATSVALGAGMALAGMPVGATGNIASGITGITGTIGSIYQHSRIPNQVYGDTNGGDVNFGNGNVNFTAYYRTIKAEYAAIIDNYFSMFGYKVNNTKIPNITGRAQWNFIKTIDCNVEGDIPQEDLDTVRKACNSGITFWHNPANIYNYSLANNII